LGAALPHRGEKQAARTLSPKEERRIAPSGALVEARHDDGAELEALRLVDRHDLEIVVARLEVGQRVELPQAFVQRREVLQAARALEALELVEIDLGVLEVGRARHAGRAAERKPDALDALAQAAAAAAGNRFAQDAPEPLQFWVSFNQFPNRGVAVLGCDLMEIVEGQADPRGAQEREPGDAVAEMRERARERVEVLHHLLLAQ